MDSQVAVAGFGDRIVQIHTPTFQGEVAGTGIGHWLTDSQGVAGTKKHRAIGLLESRSRSDGAETTRT